MSTFRAVEYSNQQSDNSTTNTNIVPRDRKGKTITSESSKLTTKQTEWFKCHDLDHFVYQCPTQNLSIGDVCNEDGHGIEEETYEPQASFRNVEDNLISIHLRVVGTYILHLEMSTGVGLMSFIAMSHTSVSVIKPRLMEAVV